MSEERPQYLNPNTLIEQLRGLSRYENSDFSLGDDAADEIEALRREVERLRDALEVAANIFADIQLQASIAARAAVKQIQGE